MSQTPSLFEHDALGGWRPSAALRDGDVIDPTRPIPPANHRPTSRAAARAVRNQLPRRLRLVMTMLAEAGQRGATREELAQVSERYGARVPLQSVCGLAHNLLKRGLVVERGTRRTMSGRQAAVLVLSVLGRQEVCDG